MIYSHTRIDNYISCARKYKAIYLDKLPRVQGDNGTFGTLNHESLKDINNAIKEGKQELGTEDIYKIWDKHFQSSEIKNRIDYYNEGRSILNKFAVKNLEMKEQIFQVEYNWHIKLGDIELQGYADRLDVIDTDTLIIWEYKTRPDVPRREEVETDRQVLMYDLAIREMLPTFSNVYIYYYLLRKDFYMRIEISPETREGFKAWLKATVKRMQADTEFKPTLDKCEWCPLQGKCDLYLADLEVNKDLWKSYTDLKQKISILTEQLKTSRKQVIQEIERTNEPIKIGNKNFILGSKEKLIYKPSRVNTVLSVEQEGFDFDEIFSVKKTNLDTLIATFKKSTPELTGKFQDALKEDSEVSVSTEIKEEKIAKPKKKKELK